MSGDTESRGETSSELSSVRLGITTLRAVAIDTTAKWYSALSTGVVSHVVSRSARTACRSVSKWLALAPGALLCRSTMQSLSRSTLTPPVSVDVGSTAAWINNGMFLTVAFSVSSTNSTQNRRRCSDASVGLCRPME